MAPNLRAAIVLGVASLLALIALFVPWWSLTFTINGSASTATAAPFDDAHGTANGVLLTGIFWCIALLCAVGGTVTGLLGSRTPAWLSPTLCGVAALLFVLMPLLAIATWPPSDTNFWGSGGSTSGAGPYFGGVTTAYSTYATVGWYMALVAGLVTATGAALAVLDGRARLEPAPTATQA